jgi:serine/threonine protein kinase
MRATPTTYLIEEMILYQEFYSIVLPSALHGDIDLRRVFDSPAGELASRLDHPYAAHIYAFGAEPDGLRWIAMELVRGTALDQLLRLHGPLPLDRFVPFLERLCEVVHTAHEQGIVHRDIKTPEGYSFGTSNNHGHVYESNCLAHPDWTMNIQNGMTNGGGGGIAVKQHASCNYTGVCIEGRYYSIDECGWRCGGRVDYGTMRCVASCEYEE